MGFDYQRDASGIVIVTMDMDGQSANTMSQAYHDLMGVTVARLEAEDSLAGVVFASAKKTFFAGGDLHGLLRAERGDDAYKAWLNEDKGFLRRIERLPVPVVAAINGAALGGGFEICLSCNHRIVVDDAAAVVGLPEVTLGLLPGAGGVSRLPRLMPLDQALDLLLSGRFVPPQEALSLGLVDKLVAQKEDLIPAALDYIKSEAAVSEQPWDIALPSPPQGDLAADRALIARTRDEVTERTRGKMPAPLRILDIVEQGLELDLDRTLLVETEAFAGLLGRPETRAAISLNFFAANAIRSGKLRPKGERTRTTSLVVLGDDPRAAALTRAASRKLDLGDSDADMLLEVAGQNAAPGTFAYRGIEVARLLTDLAGRDLADAGLFGFRIPRTPEGSKLVEIIAGPQTANTTLRHAYDLFQRIGYTPIVVRDVPGHFVARLQAAFAAEALALQADGVAPEQIDRMAYDAGMTASAMAVLADPAVRRLVSDHFSFPEGGSPQLDDFDPARRAMSADAVDDAVDRLLFAQAVEALRAFDAQVVATEEECDVASVLGAGFPAHTGGALRYVRGIGVEEFAARAAVLTDRYGDRFDVTEAQLTLLCPAKAPAA